MIRSRAYAAAAAALLCAAAPATADDQASARTALLTAVEKSPDLPSSAKALESSARALLNGSPDDYAGFLALCKAMRISGRAQEGLPNCKRAMQLDPVPYPSYRELGLAYAAAGNSGRAIETLQQGVELSSTSEQAYCTLAGVLEKHGDAARAHSYYQKGLALPARSDYYRALLRAGARRTAQAAKQPSKPRSPAGTARQKPAAAPQSSAAARSACLDKFKAAAAAESPATALAQGDACLKLMPSDAGLAAGRAPLMVRLGRYEDGVKEYERAAGLYTGDAPMAAFCLGKAAETWLKLGDPAKAEDRYRKAAALNPRDLNALKGLAAAQEARSDLQGAASTYDLIIGLDPADTKTRTRREELRTASLTGPQVLEELRLRQAVPESRTEALPEDLRLFKAIRAAETGGGVDYVKKKSPGSKGLVAERAGGEGPRLMLTAAGYKAYVFFASKDAIKFFEGEGVGLREIFQLRTQAGAQVFDKSGKLTQEGEDLWRAAAKGSKTWLLPYEAVPSAALAQASKEAEARITELQGKGFREISEPEYLWLLKATTCPDATLKRPPVNAVEELHDGTRNRYLLCSVDRTPCMNQCNSRLPEYIAAYRANNAEQFLGNETHSSFFGTGAKARHFCENGEVWVGNVGADKNPCSTALPVR